MRKLEPVIPLHNPAFPYEPAVCTDITRRWEKEFGWKAPTERRMEEDNGRQQQELEEERQQYALDVLGRVRRGWATEDDVKFLAAELGISKLIGE